MRLQRLLPLVGALALVTPGALTARQFEGVIKQRSITVSLYALESRGIDVTEGLFDVPIAQILALHGELGANGNMTVTEEEIMVKGPRFRTDATDEEGPAYATVDLEHAVMRLVRPNDRMYIEMSQAELDQMAAMGGMGRSESPDVIDVGETRNINGMNASAYDVETDEGTTRVWVSNDNRAVVASFRRFSDAMASMSMGEVDASLVVADHGFPVLVQKMGYDTYEIEEVWTVNPQSIDDAVFAAPAGFRKMTMAEMMSGMPPTPEGMARGAAPGNTVLANVIEYAVTGAANVTGRDENAVICSGSDVFPSGCPRGVVLHPRGGRGRARTTRCCIRGSNPGRVRRIA